MLINVVDNFIKVWDTADGFAWLNLISSPNVAKFTTKILDLYLSSDDSL